MKRRSCFLSFTLCLWSCSAEYKGLDLGLLAQRFEAQKGIIVSCIRCSCVSEDLKDYLVNGNNTHYITIYGDSACVKNILLTRPVHIKQSLIDSIYEANYNLMLYKKEKSSVRFRLIPTEQCDYLTKIADDFFK